MEYVTSGRGGVMTAEGDFCISELTFHPQLDHPFKTSDYSCCVCVEGSAKGSIGLMPCELRPSYMSINVPGQLLEQHCMSRDFRAVCICMSEGFVKGLGLSYNFHLNQMLKSHPVIQLLPSQMEAIMTYRKMVERLLTTDDHPFQHETLHHLTCAFFYGLGSYLYNMSKSITLSNEEDITRRFIDEVSVHFLKERKVNFYADRLNITHGYLSSTVKAVSGKTPLDWIEEYVAKEACALLRGSTLTVQQISQHLGFPSQSFFGKYFKRIIGCTPLEYRGR